MQTIIMTFNKLIANLTLALASLKGGWKSQSKADQKPLETDQILASGFVHNRSGNDITVQKVLKQNRQSKGLSKKNSYRVRPRFF